MNSSEKGDKLEDAFYQYLLDQQERGELVYGAYPPSLCKIRKKPKYYCKEREADVEFDVVIEFYLQLDRPPHFYTIFECKNHNGNIQEIHINDFSSKIGRIFKHAAKGVVVVSTRLQSGAEKVARNAKMGIIKYDENGLDIIADRVENNFVKSQLYQAEKAFRSLKFSAYYDGKFFSTTDHFLRIIESNSSIESVAKPKSIPYLSQDSIKSSVQEVLKKIDYKGGPVNLKEICLALSIDLQFSEDFAQNVDGVPILGSANFNQRKIQINANGNLNRERFTLAHEIGHFCLQHQIYLSSETIIEQDLLVKKDANDIFNYERLEFQANSFASNLLLPDEFFKTKIAECRQILDINDRGHGYIFVDDQPCNYISYQQLLLRLSSYFEVSKEAIEIKIKNLGMITDQRKMRKSSVLQVFKTITPY